MFYVAAYLVAIFVFCLIMAVCVDRWHKQALSAQVLFRADFDDWCALIRSSAVAGADMRWQLEILNDLETTGYSRDAEKLLNWMEEQ